VVGAYYLDLVFRELPAFPSPGREVFAGGFDLVPGGAFSIAMALRRLGRDVIWAVRLGTDPFSRLMLEAARAEGLDEAEFLRVDGPVRGITSVLSDERDRAMVSFRDPFPPLALAPLLRRHRPRLLVLPELRYDAAMPGSLRIAHRIGTEVFMDCQDVPGTLDDQRLRRTLKYTDLLAPNADEAQRLTGSADLDEAVGILAGLVGTIVIKRGAHGATAMRHGRRHDLPALPVPVVDTTGAGDCFNAGFLHAHLDGRALPDCLTLAVMCGAAATTGPGSSRAPTLAELPQLPLRPTAT